MNNLSIESILRIIEARLQKSLDTIESKHKEYKSDENIFYNFTEGAKETNGTSEQALWGYMIKHFVSVKEIILKDGMVTKEYWDEKMGDLINYFLLLDAMKQSEFLRCPSCRDRKIKSYCTYPENCCHLCQLSIIGFNEDCSSNPLKVQEE